MSLQGVVLSVSGNFDRHLIGQKVASFSSSSSSSSVCYHHHHQPMQHVFDAISSHRSTSASFLLYPSFRFCEDKKTNPRADPFLSCPRFGVVVAAAWQVRKEGGRVDNLVHKNVNFVVCDESSIKRNTQVPREIPPCP